MLILVSRNIFGERISKIFLYHANVIFDAPRLHRKCSDSNNRTVKTIRIHFLKLRFTDYLNLKIVSTYVSHVQLLNNTRSYDLVLR